MQPTGPAPKIATVEPGFTVDADVALVDVPDARGYAYFYVDDRPALVDTRSRTVIWIE